MPVSSLILAKTAAKRATIGAVLTAAGLMARTGALASARGLGAIFTLHHVCPESREAFRPNAHLAITPRFLARSIERLLAMGLKPARVEDLPARLAGKDKGSHGGGAYFAFTLDDGYRDNLIHALPVFERYGVPFTVFVTRGFAERTHSIWWETAEAAIRVADSFRFDFGRGTETLATRTPAEKQAVFARLHRAVSSPRQDDAIAAIDAFARENGIDPLAITGKLTMADDDLRTLARHPLARLGAHTVSHPNLACVPAERLVAEIEGSAEHVRSITGFRPEAFAYPYGDAHAAGPREFDAVAAAGFGVAVTTTPGMLSMRSAGRPTALNRISLNGHFQKPHYVEALASGIPFRLLGTA